MVAPQHIYRDWLKVVAKTIAVKQDHQNQAITTQVEVFNDQHIKNNTMRLTRGVGEIYQGVHTKSVDQQKCLVV